MSDKQSRLRVKVSTFVAYLLFCSLFRSTCMCLVYKREYKCNVLWQSVYVHKYICHSHFLRRCIRNFQAWNKEYRQKKMKKGFMMTESNENFAWHESCITKWNILGHILARVWMSMNTKIILTVKLTSVDVRYFAYLDGYRQWDRFV